MAQHRERFAGISAFLLRLWDGSGLISPVTHRCLASSSFRARGYVYSQADFFVGTGNAISFPRSSPAPFHSHPHWQRTESHNRGFFRIALHTAHDLIHMVLLHRESDRDLDSLIATGLSLCSGRTERGMAPPCRTASRLGHFRLTSMVIVLEALAADARALFTLRGTTPE